MDTRRDPTSTDSLPFNDNATGRARHLQVTEDGTDMTTLVEAGKEVSSCCDPGSVKPSMEHAGHQCAGCGQPQSDVPASTTCSEGNDSLVSPRDACRADVLTKRLEGVLGNLVLRLLRAPEHDSGTNERRIQLGPISIIVECPKAETAPCWPTRMAILPERKGLMASAAAPKRAGSHTNPPVAFGVMLVSKSSAAVPHCFAT